MQTNMYVTSSAAWFVLNQSVGVMLEVGVVPAREIDVPT